MDETQYCAESSSPITVALESGTEPRRARKRGVRGPRGPTRRPRRSLLGGRFDDESARVGVSVGGDVTAPRGWPRATRRGGAGRGGSSGPTRRWRTMSDAMRPHEEARTRIAATEKRDAAE
jgi:hypothetical protein